jgi:hypothetical protein
MAIPLRDDRPDHEITTADIARGQQPPVTEPQNPKPVMAERNPRSLVKQDDATPLFPEDELDALRARWKEVQNSFVDEPRSAVEQADNLVASAMKRLAEVFASERSQLEQQWDRGDSVSTEDLRVALQRYRTFFHRLLSV